MLMKMRKRRRRTKTACPESRRHLHADGIGMALAGLISANVGRTLWDGAQGRTLSFVIVQVASLNGKGSFDGEERLPRVAHLHHYKTERQRDNSR